MNDKDTTRISVLSDTHNTLPRALLTALKGSSLIIHAGDFATEAVLTQLEKIAPVAAVRGNCDTGVLATLPHTVLLERGRETILVVHDLNTISHDTIPAGVTLVICGHTHVPVLTSHGAAAGSTGQLRLSAGRQRPLLCRDQDRRGNNGYHPQDARPPSRGKMRNKRSLFAALPGYLLSITQPPEATMAQHKTGDNVTVHYRGTLDDGTEFDNSRSGEPLTFTLGKGEVIPGFDAAVTGMQAGRKKP